MRKKKQWNYGTVRRIFILASGISFAVFLFIYGLLPVFWYELTSNHTIGRIGTICFFLTLLFLLVAFFLPYAKQHEGARRNAGDSVLSPEQDSDGCFISPSSASRSAILKKGRQPKTKRFRRNRRN